MGVSNLCCWSRGLSMQQWVMFELTSVHITPVVNTAGSSSMIEQAYLTDAKCSYTSPAIIDGERSERLALPKLMTCLVTM